MRYVVGVVMWCVLGVAAAQEFVPPRSLKTCTTCVTPFVWVDRVVLACKASTRKATLNPLKLCNLCDGYTISKRGDDVLVRCPAIRPEPWLTIQQCAKPTVTRNGNNVEIKCGK